MDQQRAPASLTKIMTALLALEAIENGQVALTDIVTAQDDCREGLSDDSSTSGIVPGVQISMKDLLYCALLQSANEACNIIGSYIAGSVGAFVEKMNSKAQELGCTNTHFMNTNGLPAEGHYSSAYDLYLITEAAASYPLFMEICDTSSYSPECTAINETMYNSNALICAGSIYGNGYLYDYASGVKTGYTNAAGYCLISTAEKNNVKLMAVVMGCDGQLNAGLDEFWNFIDSIALYEWGFDNFSYQTILGSSEIIDSIPVAMAEDGVEAILRPVGDMTVLLPNDVDTSRITRSVTVYNRELTAPLAAGTVLGEMTLSYDGDDCGTIKLVNSTDIELSKTQYLKMRVNDIISRSWVMAVAGIVAGFLLLYLILVMRYRRLRRKHLKERRKAEMQRRYEREQAQSRYEQYESPEDEPLGNESDDPDFKDDFSRYFDDDFNSDYKDK